MVLNRSLYNALDGFDEDYFMYGEDIDFSFRSLKKGYDNYYFGGTSVIHFKGESTRRNSIYIKRFYGAMQIFYKKHFKANVLFDLGVFLGIKLMTLLKSSKQNFDSGLIGVNAWAVLRGYKIRIAQSQKCIA